MILVTGGTGFLGTRVVRGLIENGVGQIRCFVRDTTAENVFDPLLSKEELTKIELFRGNFNNSEDLKKALKGADTVIHLAASTDGSVPIQIANTVIGSENLFNACKDTNIERFVLCSSLGVLKASTIKKNAVIDETCPIEDRPELRDPYSHAKIIQEQLAWKYHKKENLPLVVIRPSVIFGPPQPVLSARIGISLFGIFFHLGGNNTIPLTYKDNCADAFVQSVFAKNINGEVFHILDDDLPVSKYILKTYKKKVKSIRSIRIPYLIFYQLSKIIAWYSKKTKGHLPPVFTPYKVATMWRGHKYSNAKAKEKLKWEPKIKMNDALEKTMQYEIEQNNK